MASSSSSSRAALLSAWDSADSPSAPITSKQREALETLKNRTGGGEDDGSGDESGADEHSDRRSESKAKTATSSRHSASASASATAERALFPSVRQLERSPGTARLDTGEKFLAWRHSMEDSLRERDDEPYRKYVEQLERHARDADDLLSEVNGGLDRLRVLTEQHAFVSAKSNSLHTACQHLLEEQNRLTELSEEFSARLVYFTDADRIAQKLQSPTLSVNSETFLQLLDRIDECYAYILDNPSFKQSGPYGVKYQACLSRALGMVRTHVKGTLDAATGAATPSAGAQITSSTDTAFALFYGKFRSQVPKVGAVIGAVERRTEGSKAASERKEEDAAATADLPAIIAQEYDSALFDIHGQYFACRTQLLLPSVRSAVADLSLKYKRDHCGLVRAGCAFLLHVCEDEYQLFKQFFSTAEATRGLAAFLEGLCQVLYDTLRPLVIHLHHLETLSELTGILRSEMLGHHCAAHPPQLSAFETVLNQLLQDVQERLVYRAHIYIRTDISDYAPSPGDLAYPEKLEMMESIAESIQQQQQQASLSRQQSTATEGGGHRRQNSTSSLTSATSLEVAAINGGAIRTMNASSTYAKQSMRHSSAF